MHERRGAVLYPWTSEGPRGAARRPRQSPTLTPALSAGVGLGRVQGLGAPEISGVSRFPSSRPEAPGPSKVTGLGGPEGSGSLLSLNRCLPASCLSACLCASQRLARP